MTRSEVDKKLNELADCYVEGMRGKARRETRAVIRGALEKAAWYGAHCAAESAGAAADRLFRVDWVRNVSKGP